MKRSALLPYIFAVVLVFPLLGRAELALQADPVTATSAGAAQAIEQTFGQLPLYFVENQGQIDEQVAYYIQGSDKTIYFTSEGVTFALTTPLTQTIANPAAQMASVHPVAFRPEHEALTGHRRWVVKLNFVGANPHTRPVGADRTETTISLFGGPQEQWHAGLPTYSRIVYPNLWPGIDLVYYGTVNALKYEFVVNPGADPAQIRLAYSGAEVVTVNAAGQLEATTPLGSLVDDTPVAYQDVDGQRVPVSAAYEFQDIYAPSSASRHSPGRNDDAISTPRFYAFALGPYDPARPLIIDPVVLVYCGYIGGDDQDGALGIAVDEAGNAYIGGSTSSTQASFPVTSGPDLTYNGNTDAFVAKINAAGTDLIYAGYIGGDGKDEGADIAVDSDGNAYITGVTASTEASFPVTGGPDLTHNGAEFDAFVAKVNASGSGLVYAGYIGGSHGDHGRGIDVDAAGSAYIIGWTRSDEASFPVANGPDVTYNGGNDYGDAFVAKVNASGSGLVYAGYIGGDGDDYGENIAVDSTGNAFVTGHTDSAEASFPVSVGPDLTYNGGDSDAFVAKVNASGSGLVYAGYIGGDGIDQGADIAAGSGGNAYIAGYTRSTQASFPVTGGPDLTYNGNGDAFVAMVNESGSALAYSGYIGGSELDNGTAIAVDGAGNAYVAGYTKSTEASFPVTVGPDLTYNGGSHDAFLAMVNAIGSDLIYAGYIGGNGAEYGTSITTDGAGGTYITGWTTSSETSFPVTVGPDLTLNGVKNAFVAKVTTAGPVISGRVTDAGSNPIANVLVLADSGLAARSSAGGCYTLTAILTGTYTLTPTLSGASFLPVTRTVTVTATDVSGQDFTGVIPPTGLTITGPLTGTVGTVYTFTAAVRPVTTTMPITYTWTPMPNGGQGTTVATYTWITGGNKIITVTADNAGGTVGATHVVAVGEQHCFYLPLVLRQPASETLSPVTQRKRGQQTKW